MSKRQPEPGSRPAAFAEWEERYSEQYQRKCDFSLHAVLTTGLPHAHRYWITTGAARSQRGRNVTWSDPALLGDIVQSAAVAPELEPEPEPVPVHDTAATSTEWVERYSEQHQRKCSSFPLP